MLVTLFGIDTKFNFLQKKNVHIPIFVTLSGIVIFVIPLHSNAPSPILVTLSGIVIFVIPLHLNAPSPIFVTLLGIVTLAKLEQSAKA